MSAPSAFDAVIGQPEAVASLARHVAAPVHAYLFVGPAGSGRMSAARAFAAALLCSRGGCGECRDCRLALDGRHVDVVEARQSRRTLRLRDKTRADDWTVVDLVRAAMTSPVEGRRKVIVVPEFDAVEPDAVPALLKTLEEPPDSTVFVLLATRIDPEWVTIASRCVQVPFERLSAPAVAAALTASGVTADHAAAAAEMADGNLDLARLLAGDASAAQRWARWQAIPEHLDGRGATVAATVDELRAELDRVADELLAERHAAERAALERDVDELGVAKGRLGELDDQHRQERRRIREAELRMGLRALAGAYRVALASADPMPAVSAVAALGRVGEALERNPHEELLLQRLLLELPPVRRPRVAGAAG